MSEAKMIPLSEFHLLGEREKMFLEVFSIGGISTMQDHLPRTMNLSEGDDIIVSVIIASRKSEFFATLEAINVRSADETVDGILSKMHMMLGDELGWADSIAGAVSIMAGIVPEEADFHFHESEGVVGLFTETYGFYVVRTGHALSADPNALNLPSVPPTVKH
jgi:hypothetical protein